jgi:serine/threonine protein kinase
MEVEDTHDNDDTQPRDPWTYPDIPDGSFSRECLSRRILGSIFGDYFGEDGGIRLGHHRLLGKLGEGGMGMVYAAIDERLGRKVAIKLLRRRTDELAQRRLVREAKALARVSHPNVVQIHDLGEHEGQIFIVMEFVDGVDLRRWLAERKRTPREILEVFIAAGHGLLAAHAHGVIHRDFKPANIMLGSDGRVRVVDFGLARTDSSSASTSAPLWGNLQTEGLTESGAILGTPAYMAPEQLRGGDADSKTDQFSFCVALWEALHGSRPFHGSTIVGLVEAIENTKLPVDDHAEVPARVRRALARGLAYQPDQRWPSFEALITALSPAPRQARWRSAVFGVAAGLCLANLGTLSLLGSRLPAPDHPAVAIQEALPSLSSEIAYVLPYAAEPAKAPAVRIEPRPVEQRKPSPLRAKHNPGVSSVSIEVAGSEHRSAVIVESETMRLSKDECASLLSCLRESEAHPQDHAKR